MAAFLYARRFYGYGDSRKHPAFLRINPNDRRRTDKEISLAPYYALVLNLLSTRKCRSSFGFFLPLGSPSATGRGLEGGAQIVDECLLISKVDAWHIPVRFRRPVPLKSTTAAALILMAYFCRSSAWRRRWHSVCPSCRHGRRTAYS